MYDFSSFTIIQLLGKIARKTFDWTETQTWDHWLSVYQCFYHLSHPALRWRPSQNSQRTSIYDHFLNLRKFQLAANQNIRVRLSIWPLTKSWEFIKSLSSSTVALPFFCRFFSRNGTVPILTDMVGAKHLLLLLRFQGMYGGSTNYEVCGDIIFKGLRFCDRVRFCKEPEGNTITLNISSDLQKNLCLQIQRNRA